MIDFVLGDNRLADATNRIGIAGLAGQFERSLQSHLPVGMDMGRDFEDYTDIEISELRIHTQACAAGDSQRGAE